MFPKVQSVLKISSGNAFPLGKAEKPRGWGIPPFHRLSDCADGGTCSLLAIPLGELDLGFLISSGQVPKAPLFKPGSRLGTDTGQAHHEIHINIITTLSEFTVAMSTKQLGKLGLWENGK